MTGWKRSKKLSSSSSMYNTVLLTEHLSSQSSIMAQVMLGCPFPLFSADLNSVFGQIPPPRLLPPLPLPPPPLPLPLPVNHQDDSFDGPRFEPG